MEKARLFGYLSIVCLILPLILFLGYLGVLGFMQEESIFYIPIPIPFIVLISGLILSILSYRMGVKWSLLIIILNSLELVTIVGVLILWVFQVW